MVHPPLLGQKELREIWREVGRDEIVSQGSDTSVLFARSVLPEIAKIRAIKESAASVDHSAPWRIEITPNSQKEVNYFLNVLFAGDGFSSQMPMVQLVKSISGDRMLGVRLRGKNYNWNILFSADEKNRDKTMYTVEDTNVVENLICNLPPNKEFQIRKNGSMWKSGQVSKAGTIFYRDKPGGKVFYEIRIN